ncbi:MAG: hypothetical protein ACOVOQ_15135 [Flavobacterium sp.]
MKSLKLKLVLVIVGLLTLNSCVSTMPLNQQFYNTKKVGVILQVDNIGMSKAGGQGLLDMALTPGHKYEEPLKAVEPKLEFKTKVKEEITSILNSKNKQFQIIEENVTTLKKFEKPNSDKKYSKLDYRNLKAKYNVDEILILHAKHGILVSYYGVIETGKQGYAQIITEIVDLEDNSLLQQENFQSVAKINGNWKKGDDYGNLKNSIQEAIQNSFSTLKTKF